MCWAPFSTRTAGGSRVNPDRFAIIIEDIFNGRPQRSAAATPSLLELPALINLSSWILDVHVDGKKLSEVTYDEYNDVGQHELRIVNSFITFTSFNVRQCTNTTQRIQNKDQTMLWVNVDNSCTLAALGLHAAECLNVCYTEPRIAFPHIQAKRPQINEFLLVISWTNSPLSPNSIRVKRLQCDAFAEMANVLIDEV